MEQSTKIDIGEQVSKQPTHRSSLEKKPSTHDILVIETQPPKVNEHDYCERSVFLSTFRLARAVRRVISTNIDSSDSKKSSSGCSERFVTIWFGHVSIINKWN